MNDPDPGVEGHDGVSVPVLGRLGIDLSHRFTEMDMFVAAIEPPPRHLVPVTIRPFLDHLGPFLRKLEA